MAAATLDRRRFLQMGKVGLLSPTLLQVLAGQAWTAQTGNIPRHRRARACIILFQVGGPYQCDTFDPKPDATAEVRGPFRRIATSAPGVFVTEALPRVSLHTDKFAILRSVHHTIRCHNPAIYCSLVGREATTALAVSNQTAARRTDHPHYGSVVARLRPGRANMPSHVIIPDLTSNGAAKTPGLLAGYLGASHDPFVLGGDPSAADFQVETVGLPADIGPGRMGERHNLLRQFDTHQRRLEGPLETMDTFYQRAFDLLTAPRTKQAFDLGQEPASLRDRYGRHTLGQSTLLARRLVEAGVPFVSVFSHTAVERNSWDTHDQHYERSTRELLPPTDQSFGALLEDLGVRGLLDEVLVVWMGEFGRTPRMGFNFSNAGNSMSGRDHWCNCYSVVLAGGGVRGGQVVGSSDSMGAYPSERPIHISDLAATIFSAMGIDPRAQLRDIQGQLRFICDGNPVQELF
jgi:hypothetical protein